ncbi:MAG: PAS domain S-box protein [Cytophagaceae bacterium]
MTSNLSDFPHLKAFTEFIYNNYLYDFIEEVSINYRNLNVPLLKFFRSEEELQLIVENSLKDYLQNFACGRAIEAAKISIENWKANKLPGFSGKEITVTDLVMINNARKTGLLKFINKFPSANANVFPLLKELEDYYSFLTELAIQTFAEIKQEEVIERENRLKEVQSLAKVGNWEYNTVTGEVKWSEELYKIYNIDPSVNLSVKDIIPYILPEDLPSLQQSVRATAQTGGTYIVEYRIKSADGEIKTLRETGYSERNAKDQLIYRGTNQEITSQKKIEKELRESEHNFRLLAENSTDIISKHALDSTIIYISPSVLAITGYMPEELTGKKAFDYYHPEDLKKMQLAYQEVIDIPDATTATFRFRKKDGSYIWFESIGKTIRDETGNPKEIIATNRDITSRKEAELKLIQSEELLSGVLNSSLSGIQLFKSVKDDQGKIIDFEWLLANDAVLKLWNLTRDQVIGKKLLTLFPGAKGKDVFDKYIKAAEGETMAFRQYYKGEGLDHWFYIFAQKYEDGLLLSTNDITTEVKAEEELKRSNSELEEKVKLRTAQLEKQKEDIYSVFMQAPAMIAITRGPDLVFELANPLYLKNLGKTKDIIGKPVLEVFPEIKGQPIHNILFNVYNTGERFMGNEVLVPLDINNDGKVEDIYFNFVYEPLRNPEGKVDGILTHAVEVTHQVKARMELQESEDRFRTMAENIPNLAWMADADGYVFWYNKRWYDYTGTTFEQMAGFGWDLVMHPDELPAIYEQWVKAKETETFFEMVFSIKGADGNYRVFLTRNSPIRDSNGKIVRWFGTNTDITELRRAEENLERKNRELLKINNDLDNFIYTASHDLKAPVANIEGLLYSMVDILDEETKANEEFQSILTLIEKSIDRFKNTILDLTEVSKAQKSLHEDVEEVPCGNIIEDVLFSIRNQVEQSCGKIHVDVAECKTVRFSRKNFQSIVYNIISNAIKYRDPDKTLEVHVSTSIQGEYSILTVKDNGLGISESNKTKLFTMFKRFHDHVEGSGIGLYIVKRIVDNAGGKIEVESVENAGTTFKIYFPNFI